MPFINQDGLLVDNPDFQQQDFSQQPAFQGPGQQPIAPLARPALGLPPDATRLLFDRPAIGPPKVPADAGARGDLWRNLLGDFVWSLASAAEAGAKAPFGQRNRAAFAGALQGPFKRQEYEQKLALERAKSVETEALAQKFLSMIQQQQTMLPLMVDQALAKAGLERAQTAGAQAKTALTQALMGPEVEGALRKNGLTEAQIDKIKNDIANPPPTVVAPGASVLPRNAGAQGQPVTPIFTAPAAPEKPTDKEREFQDWTARRQGDPALQKYKADRTGFAQWQGDQAIGRQPGQIIQVPDPANPGNTIPIRVNTDNTSQPIAPPSPNISLSKPTTQTAGQAAKLEYAARDAQTQYGIMENLIKQKTSAADQDIVVRYFDIVMPVVGRRMNQTELTRLASVGDAVERAKIILQKFGSRQLFTDEVRQEILRAAKANLEGKQKAWTDWQAEHRPGAQRDMSPGAVADRLRARQQNAPK